MRSDSSTPAIPFRDGGVLLLDAPGRRFAPRTCRAIIESGDGDTLRVVVGGRWANRAASVLEPGTSTWAGYQHDSGVYTFAATVAARLSEHPLRLVLRLGAEAERLDERQAHRRKVHLPVTLFIPGSDGFDPLRTMTDDISVGGFACPGVSSLVEGAELGVSLELPEGPLDAMARVVAVRTWDLPDATPRLHLEFCDLTPGSIERVHRVVDR